MVKVVHISSNDTVGGAGIAAYRLHRFLITAGISSSMLVFSKKSKDESVRKVVPHPESSSRFEELVQRQYIDRNRTKNWNTHFSSALKGTDLSTNPLVVEADIIHLHWIWDFQSVVSLGSLMRLGKPVVWSFHDQRAFTGGCHYSGDCLEYENLCLECPQLISDPASLPFHTLKGKEAHWPKEALTVVGLSHWMGRCARNSKIFRGARVEVIHNSVDTKIYQPRDREAIREKLGIPTGARCLLFASDYGNEIRKGFGLLAEAFKVCSADEAFMEICAKKQIHLIYFGSCAPDFGDELPEVHTLGYLKEDSDIANAFCAADIFLMPSIQDNLPNTVLESLACGTPVLAFNNGGLPDMIVDGENGWLVENKNCKLFGEAILKFCLNPMDAGLRENCRESVVRHFSPKVQVNKFKELYEELSSQGLNSISATEVDQSIYAAFPMHQLLDFVKMKEQEEKGEECEERSDHRTIHHWRRHIWCESNEKMSLTVIIPTMNNSSSIEAHCLIVSQFSHLVSEVIIVDSSEDNTLEICEASLPKNIDTKVIKHPPGLYASWNAAIKAVTSEYVYISTIGDTIKPNFLEKLLVSAEEHRLDLVISPPEFIKAKPNYQWPIHKLIERFGISGQKVLNGEDVALFNYLMLSECGLSSLSGSFASNVARADLLKAHPFPTDYAGFGDVLWFAQVCGQIRLGIVPDVGSSFLCHESNHQKLPEADLYRCWIEAMDIVAGQLGTKLSALKKATYDFHDHKMKFKQFKKENPGLLKEPFKKLAKSLRKKILRQILARELRAFNNQFISVLNNSESRCNHSHKLDVFTE